MALKFGLLVASLSVLSFTSDASAQTISNLRIHNSLFIGTNFFVAVIKSGEGWVRLESSDDLRTWKEDGNFLTSRDYYVFPDENAWNVPRKFYRVTAPGTSVSAARELWQNKKPNHYSYRIRVTELTTGRMRSEEATVRFKMEQRLFPMLWLTSDLTGAVTSEVTA